MLARGIGRLCRFSTPCPYRGAGLLHATSSRPNQTCIHNGQPPAHVPGIRSYHGRKSPRKGNAYAAKSTKGSSDEQPAPEESAPDAEKNDKANAGENSTPTESDPPTEESKEARPGNSTSGNGSKTLPRQQAAQSWLEMLSPHSLTDAWRRFKVWSSMMGARINRICRLSIVPISAARMHHLFMFDRSNRAAYRLTFDRDIYSLTHY